MSNLLAFEYVTLDGVIEAPEKWQFPFLSDDLTEAITAQILDASAILLGRITYEIFAASWPSRTNNEFGIADKLNSMPKYVVSKTLQNAEWHNTTLIRGDVAEETTKLKQQPGGDIAVIGSGKLLATLIRQDLIDECRLMLHPIVLGSGQRLFPDGLSATFSLVETRTYSSGVVLLRYKPAA
jgi:dihydrofolate reductase